MTAKSKALTIVKQKKRKEKKTTEIESQTLLN